MEEDTWLTQWIIDLLAVKKNVCYFYPCFDKISDKKER